MHSSEVCSSILENRPKNSSEYMNIIRVIINVMIESDEELRMMFHRELLRNISTQAADLNPTDKTSFSAFRYFFRLACELQLLKVANNKYNSLSTLLNKLVIATYLRYF